MYLVCGLGNPGNKFINTRHNVGFLLIEKLITNHNFKLIKKDKQKELYKGTIGKHLCFFLKPQTFMNLSGSVIYEVKNYYKIKNSFGEEIIIVQIAGLIARRIVTETSIDEELQQGSRIGMIRFGSRADLYFENYEPLVKVNQKTIAGETLIAKK